MIPLSLTLFTQPRRKDTEERKGETHEKFEIISQSSRESRLHLAVAVRRSDSDFDCDLSGARLYMTGAKPLKIKKLVHDHTMPYVLESKGQRADMYRASEV